MADRKTTAPNGGERVIGEGPEDQVASAVLEDLESLRSRVTVAEGSSQSGAQSIVYELDTLWSKGRRSLEQLSLVILCSCANKSQTNTTEQCQVAAGSIWDGPVAEQQRDEYLALLQRIRADFENYQKRIQRDLAEERRYAHAAFARELLPVLDNLRRALDSARQQAEKGPLVQGVALVQSQLLEILGRFGVTPIGALGQPFDPNLHEGVQQQPRTDVAPGTVVEVLEPGYRLHERVLRPARVVVAAPPTPDREEAKVPSSA